MKTIMQFCLILLVALLLACSSKNEKGEEFTDKTFADFEETFLDNYWKQYPSASIFIGYGKYYENLVIPGGIATSGNISFPADGWIH